jgi:protein-disulfide isomerase
VSKQRQRILWILFAGLALIVALGACRPAAEEEAVDPLEGLAPAKPAAAAPESTRAAPAAHDDLIAQVPTPPPGALVPTPASPGLEPAAVQGSADAPITVVEFSDYQCPFCLRYIDGAYPQVIQNYVETGLVRYIFADFPLQGLHPQAVQAAEAARCAGDQDAYWEMHDRLFAAQDSWSGRPDPIPAFVELAKEVGLDADALRNCLEIGHYREAVVANLAEGQALGVTGTPTFFINGYPIVGAQPFDLFELAFALAEADRLGDAYAQVPTPTPMPADQIPTAGSPVLGSADAPLVMIEYSDYQCPFCSRYKEETFPRIKEAYIDTGLMRYVFKDFPLSFHAQAHSAAQAARCAGDQGDYWGMHNLLFLNQAAWSNAAALQTFQDYAGQLGLDAASLASCLEEEMHAAAVDQDLQEGLSLGVTGTPAFFVGDRFISGAQPYEVFQQAIESALSAR